MVTFLISPVADRQSLSRMGFDPNRSLNVAVAEMGQALLGVPSLKRPPPLEISRRRLNGDGDGLRRD